MSFQDKLILELKPANTTFFCVAVLHLAAFLALWLSLIPVWAKVGLFLLVLVSLFYQVNAIFKNLSTLVFAQESWYVDDEALEHPLDLIGSFSIRYLVVLHLRNKATKVRLHRFFIAPDSLDKNTFRQLRAILKLNRGAKRA